MQQEMPDEQKKKKNLLDYGEVPACMLIIHMRKQRKSYKSFYILNLKDFTNIKKAIKLRKKTRKLSFNLLLLSRFNLATSL
jgi:hypothetical protein